MSCEPKNEEDGKRKKQNETRNDKYASHGKQQTANEGKTKLSSQTTKYTAITKGKAQKNRTKGGKKRKWNEEKYIFIKKYKLWPCHILLSVSLYFMHFSRYCFSSPPILFDSLSVSGMCFPVNHIRTRWEKWKLRRKIGSRDIYSAPTACVQRTQWVPFPWIKNEMICSLRCPWDFSFFHPRIW